MLTRRELLQTALLSAAALATARTAQAQGPPAPPNLTIPATLPATGPFVLPPLPYAYDALEPYIDTETMHIHHDKHHAAYVKNLNEAVAKMPAPSAADAVQYPDASNLIANLLTTPRIAIKDTNDPVFNAIRNNGGGHYNHSLFWTLMKKGGGGKPTRDMAAAIDKHFGSYTQFQDTFTKAALGRFGSGFAWLSLAPGGTLTVESTPNQDSPLMYGRTPLLGIDVWEHAYYLKYQNRRPEYVAAWYNTLNWDTVNSRYDRVMRSIT